VKVNIYVSKRGSSQRGYGFALVRHPLLLRQNETWKYVRCGDTAEFDLPEAIEEEIERNGIWSPGTGNSLTSGAGSEVNGSPGSTAGRSLGRARPLS
jgi:hypothetical protein